MLLQVRQFRDIASTGGARDRHLSGTRNRHIYVGLSGDVYRFDIAILAGANPLSLSPAVYICDYWRFLTLWSSGKRELRYEHQTEWRYRVLSV